MTEGIIQQVFQKFHKQSYGDCASEQDVDELLTELEKELIERIRKDLEKIDYREMMNIPRLELLGEIWVKLIGDGKA